MIHDQKNLYVVDASALPAAPGTPPSMTIAAWSRHVALEMLRKAKR
jgi:cholesterol oxidase